MAAEDGAEGRGGPVYAAHLAELSVLGLDSSSDGQVVLALASAMDDRAGVVNLAATAKQLTELMKSIRASATPTEGSVSDDLHAKRAERRRVSKAAV